MAVSVEPRRLVAVAVAVAVVALLGVELVRAVGSMAYRDRYSACKAMKPSEANPVFKAGFPAQAPEMAFPGQAADKNELRLSSYRGQVVFLSFWAPWCEPCIEEMPSMERLNAAFIGKGFTILAPASEKDPGKVAAFFKEPTRMSIVLDPPAPDDSIGVRATSWGTEKLPETYLIDKKGVVRYYFVNQRDWSSPMAHQCIQALLDE